MQIEVQTRNLIQLTTLRSYAKRRLSFAFDRHEQYIQRVEIKLSDINGPKGGEDKSCRIQVILPKVNDVIVEQIEADIFSAIDRAADRASRAINNKISRRRARERVVSHQDEVRYQMEFS